MTIIILKSRLPRRVFPSRIAWNRGRQEERMRLRCLEIWELMKKL